MKKTKLQIAERVLDIIMLSLLAFLIFVIAQNLVAALNGSNSAASVGLGDICLIFVVIWLFLEIPFFIPYLIIKHKNKKAGYKQKGLLTGFFCWFGRKWKITVPSLVLILFILFYLGAFLIQDKLLFINRKDDGSLSEQYENISLVKLSNGEYGGYFLDNGADRLLMFCYGNAQLACRAMRELGIEKAETFKDYDILIMDYPGYGLSAGRPSDSAIYEMLDSVINYVDELDKYEKKYVVGFSLGTGAAVYAANKGEWDGLGLIAPYDNMTNVINSMVPLFRGPAKLLIKNKFPSESYAKGVSEPTYIICSKKDKTIPYRLSQHLSGLFAGTVTVEVDEELSHNGLYQSREVWIEMLEKLGK